MDLKLKGKTALVTGSTKGIGKAIAHKLLEEGAVVIVHGSSQKSIDTAKTDFPNTDNILFMAANFSNRDEISKFIDQLPDIDILINNVGVFGGKDFADITDEDWMSIFEINVMSGIRMSRALFPKMLEKNDNGRIIFISSESGLNIPDNMIHYGMTKTAQLAVSRGLAKLTQGTTVTVNSVLPGPTYSDGVQDMLDNMSENNTHDRKQMEEGFFTQVRPSSLIQRFAEPEEIANLVAYVSSPLSSATNGASLKAEGGIVDMI
jgi:NAD(P)-dependent dehydrogenase (short-subunit alcohol dehydrogenase family)